MANSRRSSSQINAGSMADIAFLLLIFFLVVSTMEKDMGINRKLPKECLAGDCNIDIHQRNLLTISLSESQDVLVNDDMVSLSNLRDIVKDFVDNNGKKNCDYCNGKQLVTSSDNPKKAVISMLSSRNATYENYIAVQDELAAAYYDLRLQYVEQKFGKSISKLTPKQLKEVKEAYPFLISEAEIQ